LFISIHLLGQEGQEVMDHVGLLRGLLQAVGDEAGHAGLIVLRHAVCIQSLPLLEEPGPLFRWRGELDTANRKSVKINGPKFQPSPYLGVP